MRKVILTMNENDKYTTIKKLIETNGSKQRAALYLECSVRHINRMINSHKKYGKSHFIDGNRGRKPAIALDAKIRQTILDLYRAKYEGANFTHFSQLLKKHEHIEVSASTIRTILMDEFILSPKAKRITKKKTNEYLNELKKSSKSKKDITNIQNTIIAIEDAHPRRPRCAYLGEMLQMDASRSIYGLVNKRLDKIESRMTKIEKEVSKHEEIILRRVK